MKNELFGFQKIALDKLRVSVATALGNYRSTHTPQIVSYTAPTGAGKTIIMASLIEAIFYGDDKFPDQNDAIFVWLSDSPQLNEQSKNKIDMKADKIRLNQCVTISDDSFDREYLEDGHIYFLNTQKLSKTSNLTHHSDGRQYTIWETLSNTVREKSDRLYFIIDEAHRGAQKSSDLAKATTIMQKFLKGSKDDGLDPMPVVIGMTATSARFNRLAQGIQSTTHYVITTPDEVRASGLLKDRIVITYPETAGNDIAVLQAATDEWKNKCDHWYQYCFEQHETMVNPILLIQVKNGSGSRISATDLDECVRCVEERLGERFVEGEVVHAFGEGTSTLQMNGLTVPYVEPSQIADDKRIKVVFFKETLSTGWDCPRAETMMSFRVASDHTYIAQLLGRMVRTPLQRHINVDDTLNEVHLYLPQFNEATVQSVVDALQDAEGANIPTDVEAEQLGSGKYDVLTLKPTYKTKPQQKPYTPKHMIAGQRSIFDAPDPEPAVEQPAHQEVQQASVSTPRSIGNNATDTNSATNGLTMTPEPNSDADITNQTSQETAPVEETTVPEESFDREEVVRAINDAGLLSYDVRTVKITNYLKSMYDLCRLLTHSRIDIDAKETMMNEIIDTIHNHIQQLKAKGEYDDLVNQVMQFKLNTQIFDVFGESVDNYSIHDLLSSTDTDIDRQFRLAENRLGNEGVANAYLDKYYDEYDPISTKIDVIIFVANEECMDKLHEYAKDKFHSLNDENRRKTVSLPEKFRRQYDKIVSDGDKVSEHNFRLPETIMVPHDDDGELFSNHLFVDDSGYATIKLNGWEKKVIIEEQNQPDFVCWLRNPSRGSWALKIPYQIDGETKPAYPDFLVIRKENYDYVVDILEPHDPSRKDNLGKAKGFAEYARKNPGIGRIQLIRMKLDSLGQEKPYRLDMSKSSVRDKVSKCINNDELDHIFDTDGFMMK